MAFADSFVQAYHFRLLYLSSAMMYPIMGAMRHSYGQPWEVIFFCTCCISTSSMLHSPPDCIDTPLCSTPSATVGNSALANVSGTSGYEV